MNKISSLFASGVSIFLLTGTFPVMAQPNPAIPVYIHADDARINEKTGISVYRGHVHIEQSGPGEGISLQADEITVYTSEKGLESIVAKGKPVKYRELSAGASSLAAESSRYEYSAKKDQIVLSGKARIEREGNVLTGERIVYSLTERVANVVGKPAAKDGRSDERGVGTTLMPSSDLIKEKFKEGGN